MKRLLMTLLAAFFILISIASNHAKQLRGSLTNKCPYGHCAYIMDDGARCDKCALSHNPYCAAHNKPVTHKKGGKKAGLMTVSK